MNAIPIFDRCNDAQGTAGYSRVQQDTAGYSRVQQGTPGADRANSIPASPVPFRRPILATHNIKRRVKYCLVVQTPRAHEGKANQCIPEAPPITVLEEEADLQDGEVGCVAETQTKLYV